MSQQTWTLFGGPPQKADFGGIGKSHFFGDPPISGGRGGGVKFSPISYIYREGCLGGRPVTNR